MALAGNRLYGATQGGGANRKGTLYSMSTYGGIFTVLHAFNGADGDGPVSDLILSRNTVFGTARLANAFSQELPAPYITSVTLAGTNLTLNATNGLMGQSCTVLMSTNVASPFSQWIPVATNRLIADGPFTITATNAVDAAARQRFFILQAQ
jgi:uncharacterized repeat protein (TIGR03803 family)